MTANGDETDSFANSPATTASSTIISGISFLKRFTVAERAVIIGSTDNNVKASQFEMQIAVAGGDVNIADPATIAAANYLQTAGLIAVGRAIAILTP